MPISDNTRYPETTELIYSECAKRLKQRKLSLRLTDDEIAAGNYDRKVINRIINNKRARNNPYLIPPAYVKPLVNKLRLSGDNELFWGDIEDESFVEVLFCRLVSDILNRSEPNDDELYRSKHPRKKDLIQKVLLDDVAYAKAYPTLPSGFEYISPDGGYYPISPLANVRGSEQVSPLDRKRIRHNAISRLFRNTRPMGMFQDFFQESNDRGETLGFSKLEKRLDGFVEKSFMDFIKENMPGESSLGLRVYGIVSVDITRYVDMELVNIQKETAGFSRSTSPEQDEILASLMAAGRSYIEQVEDLQARLDAFHRMDKFGR